MQLRSFNLGYNQEEDRLLLNVQTSERSHPYWISRRAAMMLADGVKKLLEQQYAMIGLTSGAIHHAQELAAFGQSAALEKYPVTKSDTGSERISGAPLLLYQIRYGATDANLAQLALMDKSGQGFVYKVDRDLLHALLNLLQSQCDQAAWQLSLQAESHASAMSPNERRALH